MPGGLDWHDFPFWDNFHFLVFRLLSLGTDKFWIVFDLDYFLSFPLTLLTSWIVFRQFKVSYLSSLFGSLLFTFLPYHFYHGFKHPFLAYSIVPLSLLVPLWIWNGDVASLVFFKPGEKWFRSKTLWSLVICCLAGTVTGSLYYSFFSIFFILTAGIIKALASKKFAPFWISLFFSATVICAVMINLTPTLNHIRSYGRNLETPARHFIEVEMDGLSLTQLLFPVNEHRVQALADAKAKYTDQTGGMSDTATVALGFLGSFGFIFLILWLLTGGWKMPRASLIQGLAVLNISAVLFATRAGFGALFNFFGVAFFRSQYRAGIYIAFLSFFTLALVMDYISQKFKRSGIGRILFAGILFILILFGIYDQTTEGFVPFYEQNRSEFLRDRNFFSSVESSLPPGASVYQLPYQAFPESPREYQMQDYEHLRGYLHTDSLKWSYGAMRGRASDLWQDSLSREPFEIFLEKISLLGFKGIYLDRNAYSPDVKGFESDLTSNFGTPLQSNDGRMLFWNISLFQETLKRKYSEDEYSRRKKEAEQEAYRPIKISWKKGFSIPEKDKINTWCWAIQPDVKISVSNPAPTPQERVISLTVSTKQRPPSVMVLKSDYFRKSFVIPPEKLHISEKVILPPGETILDFQFQGPSFSAPPDSRTFYFSVENLKLKASL